MKYRPRRTVFGNWDTVRPLVAVSGGKATRQRAESPPARPGRGEWSGVNARSAVEASAAACIGTNHCSFRTRSGGCKWPAATVSQGSTWRRGGRTSPWRGDVGRVGGGATVAACWCQISWEEGCVAVVWWAATAGRVRTDVLS